VLLKQWLINQRPALGAGGRRFESSRPDHYHQGLMASAVSPFCVWVAFWVAFLVSLVQKFCDRGCIIPINTAPIGSLPPHFAYTRQLT